MKNTIIPKIVSVLTISAVIATSSSSIAFAATPPGHSVQAHTLNGLAGTYKATPGQSLNKSVTVYKTSFSSAINIKSVAISYEKSSDPSLFICDDNDVSTNFGSNTFNYNLVASTTKGEYRYEVSYFEGDLCAGPEITNSPASVLIQVKDFQTLNIGTLSTTTYSSSSINVPVSASSGLDVDVISNSPSVCTISGSPATSSVSISTLSPGTCSITFTQTGDNNYHSTTTTKTFSVTKPSLTVSGLNSINTKVYDGTNVATTSDVTTLTGLVTGDNVTIQGFIFNDSSAGTNKPVDVILGGSDISKYTYSSSSLSVVGEIKKRIINTLKFSIHKTYDGNTSATNANIFTEDNLPTDTITVSADREYDNATVGTNKTVTLSNITLGGSASSNYMLASTTYMATGSIRALELVVSASGTSKVYDGTLNSSAVCIFTNTVFGDDVSCTNMLASYATKTAGLNIPLVLPVIGIAGSKASNYVLPSGLVNLNTTGTITPRGVTVNVEAKDRVYNASTSAEVKSATVTGILPGDVYQIGTGTVSFNTKSAGTAKSLTANSFTIIGADGANYFVSTTTTGTATITKLAIDIVASGTSKIYDGNRSSIAMFKPAAILGDDVTVSATSSFDTKDIGFGKIITSIFTGFGGADGANYATSSHSTTTTGHVLAKVIDPIASTTVRSYNDTPHARKVCELVGVVLGDIINCNVTASEFDSKFVGTGKVINQYGITISGTSSSNYLLSTSSAQTTGEITKAPLTLTIKALNKVYDGNDSASLDVATITPVFGSNDVTVSNGTLTFNTKFAGDSKLVNQSGFSITGADASQYMVATITPIYATITKRTLNVTNVGVDKVYDSTTYATTTLSDDRVTGDNITVIASSSFANKNVGTNKSILTDLLNLVGGDSSNYKLASATSTANATITKRTLNVTIAPLDKIYDGTTTATFNYSSDKVTGDDLYIGEDSVRFENKNVGTNKVVTALNLSLGGIEYANYALASTTIFGKATITPRTLNTSFVTNTKVYDGNTGSYVNWITNKVTGDDLVATSSNAYFDTPEVGENKLVTALLSLSGSDVNNYVVTSATTTGTGTIIANGGIGKNGPFAWAGGSGGGLGGIIVPGRVLGTSTVSSNTNLLPTTIITGINGTGTRQAVLSQSRLIVDIGGRSRASSTQITLLQNVLINLGYLRISYTTGTYGTLTKNAVLRFQKDNNIPATGFVGPLTRNALNLFISNN